MAEAQHCRPAASAEQAASLHRSQHSRRYTLRPSLPGAFALLATLFSAVSLLPSHEVLPASNNVLASYLSTHYRTLHSYLHHASAATPLFGVAAQDTPAPAGDALRLTEAELAAYDGTDATKPLLLAINGTIYDVSASPAFYGPGGHYHHFAGKDASRAWVSECWDEPAQLTWRLDGLEAMFTPRWLDEQLEAAAAGTLDAGILAEVKMLTPSMLANMAKRAIDRFGSVSAEERAARRVADAAEASAKVHDALAHWVRFFAGNAKYKAVGSVVLDQAREPPPPLCAAALKKQPLRGGKLESMMGTIGSFLGGNDKKKEGEEGAQMPDFVKKMLQDKKDKVAAAAKEEAGDKGVEGGKAPTHEEL